MTIEMKRQPTTTATMPFMVVIAVDKNCGNYWDRGGNRTEF